MCAQSSTSLSISPFRLIFCVVMDPWLSMTVAGASGESAAFVPSKSYQPKHDHQALKQDDLRTVPIPFSANTNGNNPVPGTTRNRDISINVPTNST